MVYNKKIIHSTGKGKPEVIFYNNFFVIWVSRHSQWNNLIKATPLKQVLLTLILLFTTTPTFANSADQIRWLLKKPSDQDLHCLSFSL